MEKWYEVFQNEIPNGNYLAKLSNGEDAGLIIILYNQEISVEINFGSVKAVRMLDEGIVINGGYAEDEVEKYKKDKFSNIIYEVIDGDFGEEIKYMLGDYANFLELKHYIIITVNFNIDIITEWEPSITVVKC